MALRRPQGQDRGHLTALEETERKGRGSDTAGLQNQSDV